MVDRYAKFATEHLAAVASRIESVPKENVIEFHVSVTVPPNENGPHCCEPFWILVARSGIEPPTRGFSIVVTDCFY
jgi:hypothetical protein